MADRIEEESKMSEELDYANVIRRIQNALRAYITKAGLKSLVIGVSGGIDSALCCVLAKPVCDQLGIPLIGRSLPISGNSQSEITRALFMGEAFCTEFKTVNLYNYYELLLKSTSCETADNHKDKIRRGNIKARLRMIYLYDLAQEHDGLVLSTDNFTEYLLGFWTLHGDVGDYGMIQNLWKTEVYALSKYISQNVLLRDADIASLNSCIEAEPTDGLGITGSDLDQLGAESYEEVDKVLKTWLCYDSDIWLWDDHLKYPGRLPLGKFEEYRETLKDHPVVQRHIRSKFKRKNPYNIPRSILTTN